MHLYLCEVSRDDIPWYPAATWVHWRAFHLWAVRCPGSRHPKHSWLAHVIHQRVRHFGPLLLPRNLVQHRSNQKHEHCDCRSPRQRAIAQHHSPQRRGSPRAYPEKARIPGIWPSNSRLRHYYVFAQSFKSCRPMARAACGYHWQPPSLPIGEALHAPRLKLFWWDQLLNLQFSLLKPLPRLTLHSAKDSKAPNLNRHDFKSQALPQNRRR